MEAWKVVLLSIIMGLIAVPVVSAEGEYSINPSTEDTLDSAGNDYIVSPWIEESYDTESTVFSILSTYYITQGQTITHNVYVGSGVDYLEVDLNWGDTSDSLRLSIYNPSGSRIGTYYDSSDGSTNGRIHLRIEPSSGYVQQGTWKFKVYGVSVSGTEDYTFSVAQY